MSYNPAMFRLISLSKASSDTQMKFGVMPMITENLRKNGGANALPVFEMLEARNVSELDEKAEKAMAKAKFLDGLMFKGANLFFSRLKVPDDKRRGIYDRAIASIRAKPEAEQTPEAFGRAMEQQLKASGFEFPIREPEAPREEPPRDDPPE